MTKYALAASSRLSDRPQNHRRPGASDPFGFLMHRYQNQSSSRDNDSGNPDSSLTIPEGRNRSSFSFTQEDLGQLGVQL